MNVSRLFLILAARFKIILLMLTVTIIAALAVSLLLPKSYKASSTLVVNYKGTDPVTGFSLPAQLMPGFMATQVDIIKSMNVALRVVDELKLTENPETKKDYLKATEGKGNIRDWQADILLKHLDVTPSRESSILTISYTGTNPYLAAAVANAFANAYLQVSIQLKVDPSKKAAVYFNDQIKLLREQFEVAQRKLSRYQQENNFINAENRIDIENSRLNDLSSQLTLIQTQMADASARRKDARGTGAFESPDVIANPLIQNLKMQMAQAELKLAGIAERFTMDHPQYQQAKAELDRIHAALNNQVRTASNGIANNARILEKRESELQAALDAQKTKVLQLNKQQDQIKLLMNERDNAQRAYETASQRFTQVNFEGQSNQTDIAVLNPAIPPMKATSPKILLNTLLSLILGSMLGIGIAVLVEMFDRRVRSADDLVNVLKAPVLGVMTWGEPKRRRLEISKVLLPYRALSGQGE